MLERHRPELQFDRSIAHKIGLLEFVRDRPGFITQVSDAVMSLARSRGTYSFEYDGWIISASRGDQCPHIERTNIVQFPTGRHLAHSFDRAA